MGINNGGDPVGVLGSWRPTLWQWGGPNVPADPHTFSAIAAIQPIVLRAGVRSAKTTVLLSSTVVLADRTCTHYDRLSQQ